MEAKKRVFFLRDVVLLSNKKLKKERVFSTLWLDCALLLEKLFFPEIRLIVHSAAYTRVNTVATVTDLRTKVTMHCICLQTFKSIPRSYYCKKPCEKYEVHVKTM